MDTPTENLLENMRERWERTKYSEFLEGMLARCKENTKTINRGSRIAISDINMTAQDLLKGPGAPKSEEQKRQMLNDFQLAVLL